MKALISISFLFPSIFLFGQTEIWKIYNSASTNLPDNKITAVIIDKNNNKWIGSQEGLILFDGQNWKTFTTKNSLLPSNKILSILEIKNNIWVGSSSGLIKIINRKIKVSKIFNHFSAQLWIIRNVDVLKKLLANLMIYYSWNI